MLGIGIERLRESHLQLFLVGRVRFPFRQEGPGKVERDGVSVYDYLNLMVSDISLGYFSVSAVSAILTFHKGKCSVATEAGADQGLAVMLRYSKCQSCRI